MAVGPNYQRQGVGSMLMKTFCDYVDENALDAFVHPHLRVFGYTPSSDSGQSVLLKQSMETLLVC